MDRTDEAPAGPYADRGYHRPCAARPAERTNWADGEPGRCRSCGHAVNCDCTCCAGRAQ